MLQTGSKLQDRYRIEKQVGQGGMGSVYLATDERFQSTVAIKEALFLDDKYRKAFQREARLLNSLKHSALPKVTDHFVEENGQYIVMEYIDGDDLFEMMRKSGRAFPVSDVKDWAEQLLDALTYLHEQGIIHRDIKPQNLKLTPQGKIILLDFGLAKGNPTDANFQTAPQSIFGYSRNYASLEQIQGTGTDPRSDIYSLAATIYHLMTGRVPADALTRVMMVLNENKDPLEPAGKFNPEISQEYSDILESCLALKAALRPKTVESLLELTENDANTPFTGDRSQTNVAAESLLTQETRIVDPSGVAQKNSEMKTEVLTDETSPFGAATNVVNLDTNAKTERDQTRRSGFPKWFGPVAAVAVMGLIVSGVAAMVMYWPPARLVDEPESVPVLSVTEAEANVSDANVFEITNSGENADEAMTEEATPEQMPQESAAKQPLNKEKEATKPKVAKIEKKASSTTKSRDTLRIKTDEGTVVVGSPKAPVIVSTPKPFPSAVVRGRDGRPVRPLTKAQFEKLSPRAKRLYRQAMERQNRRFPPPKTKDPVLPPPE